MKTMILAALMAVFSFSAQAQQRCQPAKEIIAVGAEAGFTVRADLTGIKAEEFLAIWNAIPPQSNDKADRVIIQYRRGAMVVFISAFTNGCLSGWSRVPTLEFIRYWPHIDLAALSI